MPGWAGVQVPSGGGTKNIARIAYKSSSSTALYEYDWDPGAGATTGGTTLATGLSYTYEEPRIDAIDHYNNSTGGSYSHYKVVCGGLDPITGFYHSISSDDFDIPGTIVSSWVDFSSCPTLPYTFFSGPSSYNHYLPAVAYGSASSNQYMITEGFSEGGSNGDFYVMCPVDVAAPGSVAIDPALGNSYFLLNTNYPLNCAPMRYANSVSTPCNAVEDTSLVVWTEYTSPNYSIWGKRTAYDPGSSTGYNYKPGGGNNTDLSVLPLAIVDKGSDVVLFPNPAQDIIYISNTEGRYSIKNMLGQEVLKGELKGKSRRIDIHELSPGTYIFNGVSTEAFPFNRVFTKN